MEIKDVEKLDAYFMKNLGIKTQDFLGFEGSLNKSVVAQTKVLPENYTYYIRFEVKIQKISA